MQFTLPPALSSGDRVAVVGPSSGGAARAPHVFELGLRRLRETFELEPVVYPTARQGDEFLAAHPEARAADLHAAFRDPEIAGVIATIGGDDQLRVLPHLDPEVLRAHPTRFYGMSDNTNLALYLWRERIVSFYGAQLLNQIAAPGHLPAYTERHVRRAFFGDAFGELRPAERWTDDTIDWARRDYADAEPAYERGQGFRWRGGRERVDGRLWGGCLPVVGWHLATDRYLPAPERLDGCVLFLETAEDLPSAEQVKWTLMCMGERGLLERFDAVLVGRAQARSYREDPGAEARIRYRREQRRAIREQLERYNPDAPVVFDLDLGHTNPNAPVPVGGRVVVDPGRERVAFE
ncbi:S66 family peptidase [Halomarina pelagica]|uniref:S66 family peptidase n=1 Tax=Halomarina pelagica TaxID=2961599 RepID=UPI0020C364F8|nr:S66 peptidase family protein [Halomarina sp. BND7]